MGKSLTSRTFQILNRKSDSHDRRFTAFWKAYRASKAAARAQRRMAGRPVMGY